MFTSLTRYNSPSQLINDLNSYFIGFNSYYDNMMTYSTQSNYPRHNIVDVDNNTYRLEMALSGYDKSQLKVYTEDGRLVVEAEKQEDNKERYLYRGLSSRSFKWVRALTENLVVKEARFENGLLSVILERVVPEKYKRKDYL